MTARARALGAALGLALLVAGANASAFCVTRTCDINDPNQNCETDSTGICVVSGLPLYWSHTCVAFDVQRDGSPARSISYDQLHNIVLAAASAWQGVDCGNGTHPEIALNDFGPAVCSHAEYNKDHPNANVIMFHDAKPWPYSGSGAETLALTTITFDTTTGEIFDADIEINSADSNFVLDPNGGSRTGTPDLPGVVTHEMGHLLGLSHSNIDVATMFASYSPGMASLEADDVQGICTAMANSQRTAGDDCTPRHGFSPDCATNTGCCSTAPGSAGARGQGLGALALAFGLFGFRARRSLRRSRTAARR